MRSVTNLMIAMSIHLADVCLSFSLVAQIYIYAHERRKEASQPRVNEQDNFENFSSSSFSSRLNSIAQENRS